jgi:putative transcriptional regulator
MSKFGEELVLSAKQALDFVNGVADESKFRVSFLADINVKAIRAKLKLTQSEFASRFSIPIGTLRDWEQHRRYPDNQARVLLKVIEQEPAAVHRALNDAKKMLTTA